MLLKVLHDTYRAIFDKTQGRVFEFFPHRLLPVHQTSEGNYSEPAQCQKVPLASWSTHIVYTCRFLLIGGICRRIHVSGLLAFQSICHKNHGLVAPTLEISLSARLWPRRSIFLRPEAHSSHA